MITSKSYYTMKRQWIISSHLHEQRHSECDLNDVYKRSYGVLSNFCLHSVQCMLDKIKEMQRNKSGYVYTLSEECSERYNFKLNLLDIFRSHN